MAAPRKILVLGASGLIGRFVTDDLRERGFEVAGVARKFSASQKISPLDLELPVMSMDSAALANLLREHAADVVVNAAAYTAVDRAESEHDLAFAINGNGDGILAEEASVLGSLLGGGKKK